MKAINFFAVLSLVFSLSCKKDSSNSGSGNLKIELVAEKSVSTASSQSTASKIVAVLDVKSYNAKTGEITFNNQIPDNVGEWKDDTFKINVYHNKDAYLFSLTFSKPTFSYLYNEPVLYHTLIDIEEGGVIKTKKGWYILSGYPYGTVLGDQTIPNNEQFKSFKKEQLMNFQKIKANWDVFVDELKKSGKYID